VRQLAVQNRARAYGANRPFGWARNSGSVPKSTALPPPAVTPETTDACPAAWSGPLVPASFGSQWPATSGVAPAAYRCSTVNPVPVNQIGE
jgi:hypothetical protein